MKNVDFTFNFIFKKVILFSGLFWILSNSTSEFSLHVYPWLFIIFFMGGCIQGLTYYFKNAAYLSKKSVFILIIIFLFSMRCLFDLEISKAKEFILGSTGGVVLFYVFGSLFSLNLKSNYINNKYYSAYSSYMFFIITFIILYYYLNYIFHEHESGDVLKNFIFSDGAYQRKGSLLVIEFLIYTLIYNNVYFKIKIYNYIAFLLFTFIAILLMFYSQFIRSNSGFATILLIYVFTIYYKYSYYRLNKKLKYFFVFLIISSLTLTYFIQNTVLIEEFFSHFRIFGYGSYKFSSVESRLSLFSDALRQFDYGPLLGDLESDVKAGQAGKYPHNFLAHSLTHLGILGFVLAILIIFKITRLGGFWASVKNFIKNIPSSDNSQNRFVISIPIIIIAVLFQTITWAPFWFLVGLYFPFIVLRRNH